MNKSSSYGNVYYLQCNNKVVILILYVDDFFFIGDIDHERIVWLKQELHNKFKMISLNFAQNTSTSNLLIIEMAYLYIKLSMLKTLLMNLA